MLVDVEFHGFALTELEFAVELYGGTYGVLLVGVDGDELRLF